MSTVNTEIGGASLVKLYITRCPKLEPYITENDRTPIWDGDIFVYNSEEHHTVENFFARVPVQVKGTTQKDKQSYSIGRKYLEGFKTERGCVFFLAQVNTFEVFYATLSAEKLTNLLKQGSDTINIPLQKVPPNPLDFEKELYTFAANRNSEKVEETSPNEIKKLVEGFEELRGLLEKIENKEASYELEGLLNNIRDFKDDGTVGWREKFIYYSRKALDLATQNKTGLETLGLQFQLGTYLHEQKRYHLVENYYVKYLVVVRILATIAPSDFNKNVATTLNNLAALHDDLTRYDEAEKEYNEALAIDRELAKKNSDAHIADVATDLNNLAALHYNLTRYDEAEKEYKEALKIYRELSKTNRDAYIAYVAQTLNNLAVLHDDLTRYDEAEKEYKESLEIYRELANTNRDAYIGDVALTLENIARLQKATNRKAEAKKTAEEALVIYKKLAEAYPQIWNRYVEKTEQLLKDLS